MLNTLQDKNLYDVEEYSVIAGIPQQSVTRMIRQNKIIAQKVGRKYKIPKTEIEKLLMISKKDSVINHYNNTRELELENKYLKSQLEVLKNILSNANNILQE